MTEIPEVDVQELGRRLKSDARFVLLDVREIWEVERASITDSRLIVLPMSRLAQVGVDGFPDEVRDKNAEILVLCHHGIRSANVTRWMGGMGWKNVFSVRGGIDAFARLVDASVGLY